MGKRIIEYMRDFFQSKMEKERKEILRIAISILAILVAVLFFGINGERQNNLKVDLNPLEEAEASTEVDNTNNSLDGAESTDNTYTLDNTRTAQDDDEEKIKEKDVIICDISGGVNNPGVYTLERDSRLIDLIEAAGGMSQEGDTTYINRARILTDGEKVYIPTAEEVAIAKETGKIDSNSNWENLSSSESINNDNNIMSNSKININTAGNEELQKIPGVGPVTAEKIITYRRENGPFSQIDELKNISGIGEKTFKKMADYVTV